MDSRLVNVRLDEARLRKARQLRELGVSLSDLVRTAIDERFAAMVAPDAPRDVQALMTRIFTTYPDPPDMPARSYEVRDKRAARAAVLRTLRRRR